MRQAPWSAGIGAVALSALVAVGGTPVGTAGLDAGAPAVAGLAALLALASMMARRRVRRQPAPVRSGMQARRIGGPRVF